MSRVPLSVPEPPRATVSAEPCVKHNLGWCADCVPKAPRSAALRRPATELGPWFAARHTTEDGCASCDETIFPGDQIRASGDGGWLCHVCGDQ